MDDLLIIEHEDRLNLKHFGPWCSLVRQNKSYLFCDVAHDAILSKFIHSVTDKTERTLGKDRNDGEFVTFGKIYKIKLIHNDTTETVVDT